MARVSQQQARKQALYHLHTKSRVAFSHLGLEFIKSLTLGESVDFLDVLHLHDDDPPIRCFEVISFGVVIGTISIAGSSFLGTTLVSLRICETKSFQTRFQELRNSLREFLKRDSAELPDTSFFPVVYSYPKIGLGVPQPDGTWAVVDFFQGVAFATSVEELETDDPSQGISVWSFWDAFPQAGPTEESWKLESGFIDSWFPVDGPELMWTHIGDPAIAKKSLLTPDYFSVFSRQLVERPPMQQIYSLPVPLRGQISNVHCAPASLSMIYEYLYQEPLPQDEAGLAMNILPNGSTISGQLRGFREKVGADFDVSLDKSPTWNELSASIRSGLPAKSGIRGHARAAVGVREDVYIDPLSGVVQLTEQLLLINDPEPVGIGSQVWENVKASLLVDFILLTRK